MADQSPLYGIPGVQMQLTAATTNTILWTLISIAWLIQSRPYHPSAVLWISATALLIVCSIAAEQLGRRLTPPRRAMWLVYWIGFGVLAAASIHILYDIMHGPDPLRFPFLLNCIMDTIIVMMNCLAIVGCRWLVDRRLR